MHNGQPLSMELISKGSVRGNIHKVENLILSEKMPYVRIQKSKKFWNKDFQRIFSLEYKQMFYK